MANNDGNSWELIQDIIGNSELWPRRIYNAYTSGSMSSEERFKCVVFNYTNGLHPDIFETYCTTRNCLRDAAAWQHIRSVNQICEKAILHRRQWYSFNVSTNKWEFLDGTTVYY